MSAVHQSSLPAAQADRRPQRLTLFLLAAVFILPFAVGSGLFWTGWRPAKFGHHGQLIEPARALPESGLRQPDGRALPTSELRGKWLLVLPIKDACTASCRENLEKMQQTQLALSKEQNRVRRVLLSNRVSSAPDGERGAAWVVQLGELQQRFPGLVVVRVDEAASADWRSVVDGDGGAIHVVDPLATVMMRYPDGQGARGVLKDLERLLKYSWIR